MVTYTDICRGVTVGLEGEQFHTNTRSSRLGERTAGKGQRNGFAVGRQQSERLPGGC